MREEISREEIYRKQINVLGIIIAVLSIIIGFMLGFIFDVQGQNDSDSIVDAELPKLSRIAPTEIERAYLEIPQEVFEQQKQTEREIIFTNYFTGDECGSTAKTGSGLTTDQFDVNDKGFYTYNGYVVVAAATNKGLESDYKVLAKFNEPEEGITYYDYGDTLDIKIYGESYKAIVLDTCGACMDIEYLKKYDNGLNRIDIFISDANYSFGKAKGVIIEQFQ